MNDESSLDKVTQFVTEFVLGGRNEEEQDGREIREMVLRQIAQRPDEFLWFARQQMKKTGGGENPHGWVMGAVHTFRDSRINIDDVDAAAQHIMEAIRKRFPQKAPAPV